MKPLDAWGKIVMEAENVLATKEALPIDVLISIIKRINPTPHIYLTTEDKEKTYRLKSDLQNLLLTNYGELFDLDPVQWDENIVLLRHRLSPLLNACHAKLHTLSGTALVQVRKGDIVQATKRHTKIIAKSPKQLDPLTLNGAVEQARLHINNFEYDSARELLFGIKIESKEEMPVFLRGLSMLVDEIGAFDVALDLLFSLPKDLIDDNLERKWPTYAGLIIDLQMHEVYLRRAQ